MEQWNNQFPETKILGVSVSGRMRALVCMASRDKVDVDAFHKGIQYALENLGMSKFGFERTAVSNFKSKGHEGSGTRLLIIPELCVLLLTNRHVGSGNEIAFSHSRPQSPRSFWPVAGSSLVRHRKSAILELHVKSVKSVKSDWLRIRNEYSTPQEIGSGQSLGPELRVRVIPDK